MEGRGRARGAWGGEIPATPSARPLPLFMEHAAHSGGSTSRDAAADIVPVAAKLRARVLAYLASRGTDGATAEEIERATGLGGSTVRPRLVELREHGCVADSGKTRKTTSGRSAVVWEFKP